MTQNTKRDAPSSKRFSWTAALAFLAVWTAAVLWLETDMWVWVAGLLPAGAGGGWLGGRAEAFFAQHALRRSARRAEKALHGQRDGDD